MADDDVSNHDRRLAVRHEITVAHGDEAMLLQRRQSEAVRALLVWLAEQDDGDMRTDHQAGIDDV